MIRALAIIFMLFGFNPKISSQCVNTKNGTFISIDSLAGKTVIQRYGNVQLEENESLGFKAFEKLKWNSHCSYTIYEIEVLRNEGKISNPVAPFIITVEKVNDSVFNQTVFIEKFDYTYKNQITKISDKVSMEFKKMLKDE